MSHSPLGARVRIRVRRAAQTTRSTKVVRAGWPAGLASALLTPNLIALNLAETQHLMKMTFPEPAEVFDRH